MTERELHLKELREHAKETQELVEQGFFANLTTIPDYPAKPGIIRASLCHFAMGYYAYDDGR